MTLLYSDPLFLKHETGQHPECPDRLRRVTTKLETSGVAKWCVPGSYAPLTEEAVVALGHSARQVQTAKQLAEHGGGHIDGDTYVSPDSFRVALAAAGACVAAVDAVLTGPTKTALCLVRPPGHHANQTTSTGFCLFNNVALAARHAVKEHRLNRVLIVDWDVHHGNGTQDIFYDDEQVTFLSIHRYGRWFYPGTGAAGETGHGKGLGHTLNVPIEVGTAPAVYHDQFLKALDRAAALAKPEVVFVSAGFDAHRLDPIGKLGLDVEDFVKLTKTVTDVAKAHAHGRLVSCLEGGYNLDALAACVQAHLETIVTAR